MKEKQVENNDMVKDITIQDFLIMKNKLTITEKIFFILFGCFSGIVSCLFLAPIFIQIFGVSNLFLSFVINISLFLFIFFLYSRVVLSKEFEIIRAVKKGRFSHHFEVSKKVLRTCDNWHVETDAGYLYTFGNEILEEEELLIVEIGKTTRKAYRMKENGIIYHLLPADQEKQEKLQ